MKNSKEKIQKTRRIYLMLNRFVMFFVDSYSSVCACHQCKC